MAVVSNVEGFQQMHPCWTTRTGVTGLYFFGNNKKNEQPVEIEVEETPKKKGFFSDMMNNVDAVVDDFVYKRMGAGEQWYGKRKSNPSGNIDGDYNGMGQSDLIRIEIARVQREEMELRRQRRLEAEENGKRG
eukprot:CAMPEP_0168178690 /NCGR_PEP_ID=MMETSP0139_2-20121125/9330_1 /TAXON_ID=44445 /ORGANISM="Pseudo-nitzschia australis, Strain 10249 10 AB" /LENGTH=132 /DNA_ID=CAMNT_0008098241 /DNA_START=147 /DNA_END=545 /DNA_ORIENTATION=+